MIIKQRKQFHSFATFNMFIWIYKQTKLQGFKHKNTYLRRSCPTTSYVTAMFHPTIGQCAHQSLNNTTTLELGMMPQGIRGN